MRIKLAGHGKLSIPRVDMLFSVTGGFPHLHTLATPAKVCPMPAIPDRSHTQRRSVSANPHILRHQGPLIIE